MRAVQKLLFKKVYLMINSNEFSYIANIAKQKFKIIEKTKLIPKETDGIYVDFKNNVAEIGANSKLFVSRALMLLALNLSEGKREFTIKQTPHFDMCGVMLDMSRNAVMKVETVKLYLTHMASLGINTLMLYMEDTFEMKEYPQFGYMRGRYTSCELKEIDDFAYSLGIEVIACVQTLGHMAQYLRWKEAYPVTDTSDILLCDEPKTYELIECMFKTISSSLRSKRINIGMDEANGVGLGRYLSENGYNKSYKILVNHLNKVAGLCDKYGLKPMMWSDMFFRIASKTGSYYDYDAVIPDEVIADIPKSVSLVYWDYDGTEEERYDKMLKKHIELGCETIYAGAAHTYLTFLPDFRKTYRTQVPALKSCIKNNVHNVLATVWNDDGAECNHFFSLCGLTVFSEMCYRGEQCHKDDISSAMKHITGFDFDYAITMSEFFGSTNTNIGKMVMYGDLLFNPLGKDFDYDYQMKVYSEAIKKLEKHQNQNFFDLHCFAVLVFKVLKQKLFLLSTVRKVYSENDRDFMRHRLPLELDSLILLYEELKELHEKMWHTYNKSFGWEVMLSRYAFSVARFNYVKAMFQKYINGEIKQIDELEQPLEDALSSVPVPIYNRLAYTSLPVV